MRDAVRPPPRGAGSSAALTLTLTPALTAAAIAGAGAAAVAAVWALQARGYTPCELCLKERIPFYLGVPVAAALAAWSALAPRPARRAELAVTRAGFATLVVLFGTGAALGLYHAGVEGHLWAGPTGCSGAAAAPAAVADFLAQLHTVTVVRCDEAALRVLGLSLAAWNALLCAGLAAAAAVGWRRARGRAGAG